MKKQQHNAPAPKIPRLTAYYENRDVDNIQGNDNIGGLHSLHPFTEVKPPPFPALVSIQANCIPLTLLRREGKWLLEISFVPPPGVDDGVFTVEVGDGCALSFEQAANLVAGFGLE